MSPRQPRPGMSNPGVRRRDGVRDPPSGAVEYGLLAALLLALTLAQWVLGTLAGAIADLSPFRVAPQVFGTVVYAVVGATVAGIGYLAYRESRDHPRLDPAERVRLALACGALFVVALYVALGNASHLAPGRYLLGSFLVSVAGMGLVAVAYLRVRGVELRLGPPGRSAMPTVGGTVLAALLLVAALWAVAHPVPGVPAERIFGPQYTGSASLASVVSRVLVGSAFGVFGVALAFHGAVQETLREYAGPSGAVAGVTVLVGVYRWAFVGLPRVESVASLGRAVAALALVVLATALAVRVWRALGETAVGDSPAAAAAFGVAAVALLAGAYLVFESPGGVSVGYALGHTATVGVAAVAYERTRSVWVPIVALTAFSAAFDLVAYL